MKIRMPCLLLTLLSLAACSALTSKDAPPAVAATQTRQPKQPTLILPEATRIVVPVSVNGQGPFEFLFDTGSTHTVLSDQLATRLGLPLNAPPRVKVRGVSSVTTASTVEVYSVRAGELNLDRLRAPILTGPVMEGVDGILGMQGMSNLKVKADLLNEQAEIGSSDGAPADKQHSVVQFGLLAQRFMVVDARIAGARVKAIIDTGGSQTLGNTELLRMIVRRSRGQQLYGFHSSVVDATTTSQKTLLMVIPRMTLGKTEFLSLPVSFGDFSVFDFWGLQKQPALLIGMDALGMLGELTIDYRRKELHMVRR